MGKEAKKGWSALSTIVTIAVAAYLFVYSGIGSKIEAVCSLDQQGSGQCQFTNTGWTAGVACPNVGLLSKIDGKLVDTKVCSGIVWPNDTVQQPIRVVVPPHHCSSILGDLIPTCDLVISDSSFPETPTANPKNHASADRDSSSHQEVAQSNSRATRFQPLRANGQVSIGSCHMDECSWAKWVSTRTLHSESEKIEIEATLLGGSSSHEGAYPSSAAGVAIEWNPEPHNILVKCSYTSPEVNGERLPLNNTGIGIYRVIEISAEIYFTACHSHFDGYPSGINKFKYAVPD